MTGFAAFAEAPAPEPTTPVHEAGTAAPDAMASELAAAEAALAAKAEEPKAEEPKDDPKKDEPKDEPKKDEEPKAEPKKDEPKAEEPKKPARKRTRRAPAKKDDTSAEATDPSAVTKLVGDMVDHARDASSPTSAPPVVAAKVLDENIAAMEEIAATVADSLGELKARRDAYATLLDTLG